MDFDSVKISNTPSLGNNNNRMLQVWSSAYHEASVALQGREEAVAAQAEAIETKLTLLGATAVEDRLQEGVPQAISTLSAAGIKVKPLLN